MTPDPAAIAARLREAMAARGWDLATTCRRACLTQLEATHALDRADVVAAIAGALGVRLEWLLTGEGLRDRDPCAVCDEPADLPCPACGRPVCVWCQDGAEPQAGRCHICGAEVAR